MKTRNTIFFQGKTQYENTGDVLINKSLIELLRPRGTVILNDKGMPDTYIEGLKLKAEERTSFFNKDFNRLLLARAISGNGKTFLIAGPPGHVHGNSGKKAVRNLVSSAYFILLRGLGVRIIKIGFSIGPLGKKLKITENIRSKFTDHFLVRDSISLNLSHKIGIKKASFFPDLAWTYRSRQVADKPKNKIVLSFRNSVVQGQSDNQYLAGLKNSLNALVKVADFDIEIIYQVKRDYDFCKRLYEELKDNFKVTFNPVQVTLENAGEAYSGAYCVLTNRLHAALLGYKYGALPIVLTDINDHVKIKGIYGDAGFQDLLLNVYDDLSVNQGKFKSLMGNSAALLQSMKHKEAEYVLLSNNILDQVFEI